MEENWLKIETPERVDLMLEPAGVGSRFVAQVYDGIYKFLILLGIMLILLILSAAIDLASVPDFLGYLLIALGIILLFGVYFGYDIYFEARWNGQTPGKKKAGIRVIRDGGYPLDLSAVFIRNLVGIVDFLPFFYLLGFVVMVLNKKQQRLGDLAAGTLVIRERSLHLPYDPLTSQKSPVSKERLYHFTPAQLAQLSPRDDFIIKNYLQRRYQIDPTSHRNLAINLANTYLKKTSTQQLDFTDHTAANQFLKELYLARKELLKHL